VQNRCASVSDVGDPSEEAPGWDAIDGALAPLYGETEPKHYGTVMSRQEGGSDPIHGISVYLRDEPSPHFHFVTYGFTELWDKESEDHDTSGYGFELTFRLAREDDEEEPPSWAMHFLQNLGRYVFRTGNAFAAGHKMGLNGPIALGERTAITAICFAADPELGSFRSRNGQAEFLQVVGITDDEYRLIQDWCTDGFVELLAMRSPMLITELWRPSILDRPGVSELLQERVDREGSSETSSFAGDLSYDSDGSRVVMSLGALYAPAIRRAMLGRIRHRRSYQLMGRGQAVIFEPGEAAWRISDGNLVLGVPPNLAKQLAAQVGTRAGRYDLAIPGVTLVVAPTYIRDQSGRVIDVKGVDDAEIEELAAAENAKVDQRAMTLPLPTIAVADADLEEDVDLEEDEALDEDADDEAAVAAAAADAEEDAAEEDAADDEVTDPAVKPAAPKVAAKKAVAKLEATTSSAKKAAAKTPAAKKAANAKAAAKSPAATAATKKSVATKPAAKKAATKKPATKKPATKKPATKKPAAKKPAAKKPASTRSPAAKPAKKAAAKKVVATKPASKKASAKPVAKKPASKRR
jgi:suppressor of fused